MAWPPDELSEHAGTIAWWVSGVGVAIAYAFRQYFGVRKGLREDAAGDVQNKSWSGMVTAQNQSWVDVVIGLREELAQVRTHLEDVLASRRKAEDRAADCERRSSALESRVTELERMVKALGGIP